MGLQTSPQRRSTIRSIIHYRTTSRNYGAEEVQLKTLLEVACTADHRRCRDKKSNEATGTSEKKGIHNSYRLAFVDSLSLSIKGDNYLKRPSRPSRRYTLVGSAEALASDRFSPRETSFATISSGAQTLDSKRQDLVGEVGKFVTESRRGSGERRPRGIHARRVSRRTT